MVMPYSALSNTGFTIFFEKSHLATAKKSKSKLLEKRLDKIEYKLKTLPQRKTVAMLISSTIILYATILTIAISPRFTIVENRLSAYLSIAAIGTSLLLMSLFVVRLAIHLREYSLIHEAAITDAEITRLQQEIKTLQQEASTFSNMAISDRYKAELSA